MAELDLSSHSGIMIRLSGQEIKSFGIISKINRSELKIKT
jgi:hypothetical protein